MTHQNNSGQATAEVFTIGSVQAQHEQQVTFHHWLLSHPRMILLVFVGLTVVCLWGNLRLQKGSVMDDTVIVKPDDPYRQMHQYVLAKQHDGFDAGEAIALILRGGLHSHCCKGH